MAKQLYICNNANTDHCNKFSSQNCFHKTPHEKTCTRCCEDECVCDNDIYYICTKEEKCSNGVGELLKVKCIPVPNDFIDESEMEL